MTDESKSQGAKFLDLARALDCDEDEARFNETLSKIAKRKPADAKPEMRESGE